MQRRVRRRGMIITAPAAAVSCRARGFVNEYRKAYGSAPGPYSVYEYAALGVTAKAIAVAKSAKPADIAAALHKVSNYPGATGEIGFDSKGDYRTNATYITIIVQDKT
jgi:branched-chain amino acid transport system substrate-binding protein